MEIRIQEHTLARALERGTNKSEIIDVIVSGKNCNATNNRKCKYKLFEFNAIRNNRFYDQKRVEVIYVAENNLISTVTVYVFYGKWEEQT